MFTHTLGECQENAKKVEQVEAVNRSRIEEQTKDTGRDGFSNRKEPSKIPASGVGSNQTSIERRTIETEEFPTNQHFMKLRMERQKGDPVASEFMQLMDKIKEGKNQRY